MRFDMPVQAPQLKPAPEPKRRKRALKLRRPHIHLTSTAVIVGSCAIIVVALAALSAYLYHQNRQLKSDSSNSSAANNEEIAARIIDKVKRLYAFPGNEEPTVATVKDVNQLKNQSFFKNAQNGDNVLVFTKAKIALLYREKENRIINIGPVSVGQQDQGGSQNSATTNP